MEFRMITSRTHHPRLVRASPAQCNPLLYCRQTCYAEQSLRLLALTPAYFVRCCGPPNVAVVIRRTPSVGYQITAVRGEDDARVDSGMRREDLPLLENEWVPKSQPPSKLALTTVPPSGLKATLRIELWCPLRMPRCSQVAVSQS